MVKWLCRDQNSRTTLFHCRWGSRLVSLACCLVVTTGCEPLSLPRQWSDVEWNMRVESSEQPGTYAIAGQANLPDQTQLSVLAIRYLNNSDEASLQLNPEATYSILDYQPAAVVGGQWKTTLNLWQVAPDGKYQEAWQLEDSEVGVTLEPESQVFFLATLVPVDDLVLLERKLAQRGQRLSGNVLNSTVEGLRFAQLTTAQAIDLPVGQTTPGEPRLDDRNDGWGERYLIPDEPQNPTQLQPPENRETDAPPQPEEFLY